MILERQGGPAASLEVKTGTKHTPVVSRMETQLSITVPCCVSVKNSTSGEVSKLDEKNSFYSRLRKGARRNDTKPKIFSRGLQAASSSRERNSETKPNATVHLRRVRSDHDETPYALRPARQHSARRENTPFFILPLFLGRIKTRSAFFCPWSIQSILAYNIVGHKSS